MSLDFCCDIQMVESEFQNDFIFSPVVNEHNLSVSK